MLDQVNKGILTLEDLTRFCAENPARIFGLYPNKGTIQVDTDADFTLVDMDKKAVLTEKDMYTKTGFTSWEGMQVCGMPVYTIVRGQVVMEKGKITATPGCGHFMPGIAAG
jgi:dihydroorotase-like cyclic amidohydrolase